MLTDFYREEANKNCEKKFKMADKKTEIFNSPNSQIFFRKNFILLTQWSIPEFFVGGIEKLSFLSRPV